jgi:hypothetical protein
VTTAKRSSRSRSAAEESAAEEPDDPTAGEAGAEGADEPEKRPGRLALLGAGWKALSGLILTVATLVGLLATLGVIGGPGGGGPVAPEDAIVGAAETVSSSSFRLRVSTTVIPRAAGARSATIVGDGELDYRAGRGRMEYDLSQYGDTGGVKRIELLFNGPTLYVHETEGLEFEKPWGRLELAEFQRVAGSSGGLVAFFSELGVDDPAKAVENLEKGAGGAKKVGTETTLGVEWTHYRAQSDRDGAGPAQPEITDVWVDDTGHLRKIEKTSQGRTSTVRTLTEIDDYGVKVDAKPPPASQVFDLARGGG